MKHEILDDEKKQLIKEKLVDKYFGNNNNGHAENESGFSEKVDVAFRHFYTLAELGLGVAA